MTSSLHWRQETFGEFDGVDWLLRAYRDLIDAGLILNPDAGGGMSSGNRRLYMGLKTSEKSYVTFVLKVTNKGGHSSFPEPDNAIYRLAAGLGRIARLNFPVRLSPTTRAYFAVLSKTESGQLSGITEIFTDIDDNRAHGKDQRIAVSGFYEDVEFTYRLMKTISAED